MTYRIAPQCIDSVSVEEVFEVVCRNLDARFFQIANTGEVDNRIIAEGFTK